MKTAAAIAAVLLAALAAANPVQVRQASTDCKKVTVIFARGTTEPGTLGTVVGPGLQRDAAAALGADAVVVEGVTYAADIAGIMAESTGSGPGSVAMASQATSWAAKCPDTKVVLAGYSQGGMVVHNAAKKLAGKPALAGAVTFGDPYKSQAVSGVAAGKFKSFCATGDSVCSAGGCAGAGGCTSASTAGHIGYGADTKSAADFLKTAVA